MKKTKFEEEFEQFTKQLNMEVTRDENGRYTGLRLKEGKIRGEDHERAKKLMESIDWEKWEEELEEYKIDLLLKIRSILNAIEPYDEKYAIVELTVLSDLRFMVKKLLKLQMEHR